MGKELKPPTIRDINKLARSMTVGLPAKYFPKRNVKAKKAKK